MRSKTFFGYRMLRTTSLDPLRTCDLEDADSAIDAIDLEDPEEPIVILLVVDQSPVAGRLAVRVAPEAVREAEGFEEPDEESPDLFLAQEPRDVTEAVDALEGMFDPPWDDLDDLSAEEIAAAAFRTAHPTTREELLGFLWAQMLPRDVYRIQWDLERLRPESR